MAETFSIDFTESEMKALVALTGKSAMAAYKDAGADVGSFFSPVTIYMKFRNTVDAVPKKYIVKYGDGYLYDCYQHDVCIREDIEGAQRFGSEKQAIDTFEAKQQGTKFYYIGASPEIIPVDD